MRRRGWAALVMALGFALLFCPSMAWPDADLGRLALIDGKTVNGWEAVESTLAAGEIAGEPALRFSVVVDWSEGEPEYPIGWPRIQMSLPTDQGDWRRWEQMRLRVYVVTHGQPLPDHPLGVTLSTGGTNSSWDRNAQGLRPGEWQDFRFDLRDVPQPEQVRSVGLFISDDAYPDGTALDFCVSRLELVRYARPTLIGFDPLASVAFSDSSALFFLVKALGLGEGATAPVEIALRTGARTVAAGLAQAAEGETTVSLALRGGAPPGEYTAAAKLGEREMTCPIRLVASPWQEGVE